MAQPTPTTPPTQAGASSTTAPQQPQDPPSSSPSHSSPPGSLPVPPPGPRATALQSAFNKALEATLARCTYENFAECFPTPAKGAPDTLRAFWRDFMGRLEEVCKDNFASLLTDRNVVPSLNALDAMIQDAKGRKSKAEAEAKAKGVEVEVPIPPHTLPPASLVEAHLRPYLLEEQATLQASLGTVQTRNENLAQTIMGQREEMMRIIEGLEAVVRDLERASEKLAEDEETQSLALESRDMEMEIEESYNVPAG